MAAESVRPSLLVAATLTLAAALGLLAGAEPKYAAAAAVGLLFVALVLDNVALGLGVLTFLAFLDVLPDLGAISLAKLAGILLVVSWLATVATRRSASLLGDRPLLAWSIVLFLAWIALSNVWAEDHAAALTSLQRYAPNLLLFPIAYTAIRAPRDASRLLAVIVGGAALAAAAGIVSPPADANDIYGPARATGTVGDANQLAAALVVGAVLAGAFAVNRAYSSAARLAAGAAAGLCLLGIFLSLSRGGLIALGAALAVAVLFSGRWRARATGLAIVAGGAGIFYFASVASLQQRSRILELGGGSGRVDLWTVAGRMVRAHPVDGVGAGNFPTSSIHYLLQPGTIQRDDFIINASPFVTHNTYLQILAENGFVGLGLFLAIVALAFGSSIVAAMSFARQDDRGMEVLARGLVVATAGYLVAIFFISEMYSKLLWVLLALGPAMLAVARARARSAAAALSDAAEEPAAPRTGPAAARW